MHFRVQGNVAGIGAPGNFFQDRKHHTALCIKLTFSNVFVSINLLTENFDFDYK